MHLIEELARHAGHGAILREQILAAYGSQTERLLSNAPSTSRHWAVQLWPLRRRPIGHRTPRLGSDASGHRSTTGTVDGRSEWHGGSQVVMVNDGLSPSTDRGPWTIHGLAQGPSVGTVLLPAGGFVGCVLLDGDGVAFVDFADLVVDDGADPDHQEHGDDDPPGGVDVDT